MTMEQVALIILGIFSFITMMDRFFDKRRRRVDDEESKLLAVLQQQVGVFQKKAEIAEETSKSVELQFEKLKSENKTLREVLQGKDQSSLEYQKMGIDAMKKVDASHDLLMTVNRNIERLASAIEKHLSIQEVKETTTLIKRGGVK